MKLSSQKLKAYLGLSVLLTFVILIFQLNQHKSPDQIFASQFDPYEAPTNFRGSELTTMDDNFMLGLVKYDQGNYQAAIALFKQTVEKDSLNYSAKFLLGISFMALKDFNNAETMLKQMVDSNAHLFQDQALWYLGLLYLSDENGDNDDLSNALFDRIENEGLREKVKSIR